MVPGLHDNPFTGEYQDNAYSQDITRNNPLFFNGNQNNQLLELDIRFAEMRVFHFNMVNTSESARQGGMASNRSRKSESRYLNGDTLCKPHEAKNYNEEGAATVK
jgi:hypothetical protein